MLKPLFAVISLSLLSIGCQTGNQASDLKVLIGATTITQAGGTPIQDSVVVVEGHTIREVGERQAIPIPQNSERTDLTGKWVVPAAGGRIAPGQSADLFVTEAGPNGGPAAGAVQRRMIHGQWQ